MLISRRRPFSTTPPALSTWHILSLLLLAARLVQHVRADDDDDDQPLLKDNSANCTCYALESGTGGDSSQPYYFAYHRFWDFRALATQADQYTEVPDPVTNEEDQGFETVSATDAGYLNGTDWNKDWGIQNWGKEATDEFPVRMQNSPRNVYISQTNSSDTGNDDIDFPTYLTLRTVRLEDFQSAAEIENEQKNLMHASMRMRARVVGDEGAVAGFFTFYDDNNESDIEILTDDPDAVIHYTNQPSVKDGDEVPQASLKIAQLPSWRDWQDHRIDWLPHRSNWYLNNVLRATNTYSVPRKPSGLVLNMWSDGGEWSGNMSVNGSAELQIQWIELVFNTSGPVEGPGGENAGAGRLVKRKGKRCDVVCRVDGVNKTGFPEIAHVSAASYGLMPTVTPWSLLAVVGLISALIGL
ncbi:concanavalin A-like lectin/glucanase domain-containing protein [Macrophomina phaseolina]|uniref:Concanavalin A-like lectin/glucanase domain-containing protein n=1 Tax=Macrophomina phaseolina TaxID=35725 RepID=A0ABQ8GFU3_9PEZI|nr:concanavalin A-like lectin/glucanase domain-containing protein [Macrophomina phaseolina]